ncbi:MAG: HD domain-containing protein [Eubacterium sp.]|nr:HD domain-containing protein [Eubacterium sp.]MDY5496529.1 HD domain-containing protein [Anaerobutyricum sp.]
MGQGEDRLEKQIAFIREMDKEKLIARQTYLANGERKENDAEHAWHLALMTILLSEYANEKIDVLKTVTMVLFHDVVEIDAGDTYAYDEEGKKTQADREQKAAARLYGLLPKDQGEKLKAIWEEFEARETPESRFAHAMDNLQPVILNVASGGKSWIEHTVCLSQIMGRQKDTKKGSEVLWDYEWEKLIHPFVENGMIIDDREKE